MNKKILLFGGSFDPPHLGHLIMAQWVAGMFSQAVRLLPAGNPPHKTPLSSESHRIEMLRLAIGENPDLILDLHEMASNSHTYTVDTLRSYQAKYDVDRDNLCFILGSDSLNSLESWREPQEVCELCTLVVFVREPIQRNVLGKLQDIGAKIVLADAPSIGISSSMIRARIGQGLSIKYLVPDAVRNYIYEAGLYQAGK